MSVKLEKLKKQYQITLKTITPVHVGNGEEYINGLDFVGDSFFDINRLMREVSSDPGQMNKLCNEIEKGNLRDFYNSNRTLFSKISEREPLPGNILGKNIKKHIKTAGKVYLPGSSIKGSIRTSIAAHYAFGDNDDERKRKVKYYNNRSAKPKLADQNLIKSIFGKDPKENLMRIMTVTDSTCSNNSKVYEIQVVNSRRMKKKIILYEMIPEYTELKCTITLDQFLSEDDHRQKAKIPKEAFSFIDVVNAIHEDTTEQIEINLKYKEKSISEFYNHLQSEYEKLNEKEALLNIGAGIGWIGTTGNLIGEDMTKSIRQNLKLSSDKHHIDLEFPKTRRVVNVNGKLVPPGWVKMIFKEIH